MDKENKTNYAAVVVFHHFYHRYCVIRIFMFKKSLNPFFVVFSLSSIINY